MDIKFSPSFTEVLYQWRHEKTDFNDETKINNNEDQKENTLCIQ